MALKTKGSAIELYRFGSVADGNATMKNELGGKGANLAEMASLGIPVPAGFTIPCEVSIKAKGANVMFWTSLSKAVDNGINWIAAEFENDLPLLSVRSGARVSMPGMMDSILNIGITEGNLDHWKEKLGERTALDCYRRLIQMYSSVALGVPMEKFEEALEFVKENSNVTVDSELNESDLARLISRYMGILDEAGVTFPQTLMEQLKGSIKAVFDSWDNPRAIEYRTIMGYPDDWGTAVNVQGMVFGNMDDESCTGVVFSRDPSNGENLITGEFLINAQGEDVVAGIRTPQPMCEMVPWNEDASNQLFGIIEQLENHYKDMQDIEFTVESGKLYILQTRNAKRAPLAAFRVAHDLAIEGLITKEEAVSRVTPEQLLAVMSDTIDPSFHAPPSLTGIAAGGGVVTGIAMFSSADAVNCSEPCILVTKETNPDDIAGMNASVGILTATGGLTSHAAVVARGMNKSCVVGCTALGVESNFASHPYGSISTGTPITIDGATGNVWVGVKVPLVTGGSTPEVKSVLSWSRQGYPERVTLTLGMTDEELAEAVASEEGGTIHVDTAMLEPMYRLKTSTISVSMARVGTALWGSNASNITLDLMPIGEVWGKYDQMFESMFGITDADQAVSLAKVNALLAWPQELAEKVRLRFGKGQSQYISKLVAKGFKTQGQITKFSDLLGAEGPVDISDDILESVFGGKEAFDLAREMVEAKTGKTLSGVVAQPMYWYEFSGKGT